MSKFADPTKGEAGPLPAERDDPPAARSHRWAAAEIAVAEAGELLLL